MPSRVLESEKWGERRRGWGYTICYIESELSLITTVVHNSLVSLHFWSFCLLILKTASG
jgi:hypothetical protein